MELSQLHFAHPLWLWAALAIPCIWMTYFLFYRTNYSSHHLEKFIDRHLLPYLLMNHSNKKSSFWKTLLFWTIVWSCLTLALAGPRWSFREMETFSKDQSLVILLDLSESMNATDVKPSRLIRAKQKIEDLINLSKGVKIGLIAFAADPHMIAPLTDDKETIRHLLPSLDTDLIYIQGSRLSPALHMASTMLEAEPGNNKALLLISDGGFEDSSAIVTIKKLAEKGIIIHSMGVGTIEGAPVKDHEGNVVKKEGIPILSKLEKERFSEMSKIGNGRYLETSYSDQEEKVILEELEKRAEAQMALGKKNQFWDERFYFFLFPALPIILWWFRKGYVFTLIFILFSSTFELQADVADYFKNHEQLGKQALDQGDYETAFNRFQDSYRKGVACYRAGKFAEAEEMFRQSFRADIACHALYNLGNALIQQQKLKEAIVTYEDLLKKWPDHTKAKENLELAKKMMEQQKEEKASSENSDSQDQDKENQEKKDQTSKNSQNEDQNENQDSRDNNESEKKNERDHQHSNSSGNKREDEVHQKEKQQNEDDPNSPHKENQDREQEEQQKPENDSVSDDQQQDRKEIKDAKALPNEEQDAKKISKTQEDLDADLWLNRMTHDPKIFMKNKFHIESKKNGTTEGIDPW